MVAGKFPLTTARYRASSAILQFGNRRLIRLLRAPRGLMGLCPGRPVLNGRLAWPRPQCEWPCGPRPARCGRAAREGPLHGGHRRRHGPTCQIDRPPIMVACESTNMAQPRSSGAHACCFGVPWPTQRLPRAAERQAAGECARSAGPRAGPAASCALSCQCQPSPVRLAPVRGLDQPRTRRPTEHRPLRARRALGAWARDA